MANLKEIQDFLENLAKTDLFKIKIKTEEIEMSVQLKPDIKVTSYQEPVYQQERPSTPVVFDSQQKQETEKQSNDETNDLLTIKSPMVGTFYRKPSPDKPVFVDPGQQINKGDVVCIIEAMKLFNEIESDISGEIVKILVDDATPVEFDQPLFLVKPI